MLIFTFYEFARDVDLEVFVRFRLDAVDRFDDDARFADFKLISFAPRRVFRFGLLSSHGGGKTMKKEEQKPDAPLLRAIVLPSGISPYPPKNFTLNEQKYNLSCFLLNVADRWNIFS